MLEVNIQDFDMIMIKEWIYVLFLNLIWNEIMKSHFINFYLVYFWAEKLKLLLIKFVWTKIKLWKFG